MRIVVDTNVWISELLWKGLPTEILRLAETRHIEISSTTAIVTELERVLEYGRIQKRLDRLQLTRSDVVGFALALMVIVEPIVLPNDISVDPDDDMFITCALAARADYIVSGDQHLLTLGQWQGIQIVTVNDFLSRHFPCKTNK